MQAMQNKECLHYFPLIGRYSFTFRKTGHHAYQFFGKTSNIIKNVHPSFVFSLRFYFQAWYYMVWDIPWSIWISCPSSVSSQLLVHSQLPHWKQHNNRIFWSNLIFSVLSPLFSLAVQNNIMQASIKKIIPNHRIILTES